MAGVAVECGSVPTSPPTVMGTTIELGFPYRVHREGIDDGKSEQKDNRYNCTLGGFLMDR